MTPDAVAVQHLLIMLMTLSAMVACVDRSYLSIDIDERRRWFVFALTASMVATVFFSSVLAYVAGHIFGAIR